MKDSEFYKQAELMLSLLPSVAEEDCFALKGGTAINLFVRDMPRLSVDIDLTYMPLAPRAESLKGIGEALERIAIRIEKLPGVAVHRKIAKETKQAIKLLVERAGVGVKIEPNTVIRGSAFAGEERRLCKAARETFKLDVTVASLSFADLYGGKICAALDRQHPRDWFDVKMLLDGGEFTDAVRRAFVIYLASHNRPMAEVLRPNLIDFRRLFDDEFAGMTESDVSCDDLYAVREQFTGQVAKSLSAAEREFLLSVKSGEPKWQLSDGTIIPELPAIEWKVSNIRKMAPSKRTAALRKLSEALGV